jgi:hypothetical protein
MLQLVLRWIKLSDFETRYHDFAFCCLFVFTLRHNRTIFDSLRSGVVGDRKTSERVSLPGCNHLPHLLS